MFLNVYLFNKQKELKTKKIEIMKTLKNYSGTFKNKYNDKYNFIAIIYAESGTWLMYPSLTYEGCLKNTLANWKKRIGLENATHFEIKELS